MDIEKVKSFFDMHAASWDGHQQRNEAVIELILNKSGIRKGSNVLDVACGTGVLIGDYLKLGARVTGIDISAKMTEIAKRKFPGVSFICADAHSFDFAEEYDVIIIFNAFPHFSDPDKLLKNLAAKLKKGGRLTVAHGMSEAALNHHHSGAAREISLELPCKEKLAELMSPYLSVDIMLSDDSMYMVSGIRA